jgi:glycopeptide antibiotics resistance protein
MKNKKAKLIVLFCIISYTAILVYWMFFGFGRIKYSDYLYNFIPFKSIISSFETYIYYVKNVPEIMFNEFRYFAINIFGNIGVFIPYGILLTLLFNG